LFDVPTIKTGQDVVAAIEAAVAQQSLGRPKVAVVFAVFLFP
jgi:hypothetical protein